MRSRLYRIVLAIVLCTGGIVPQQAMAQAYPTKPIRLIVPFPPGGGVDLMGRIIAPKLSEALGQPVLVENRAGANAMIGAELVARAAPDGHTLLIIELGSLTISAGLYPNLPFDAVKDLAPVTMLGEQPNIVVVHPSLPVKSIGELLALARARPGQISYGTGGIGSTSHLVTVLFLLAAKTDMLHVPYKGLGPAITALLGAQVQVAVSNVSTALPHVKAGKLRLLAVTTRDRFPLLPEAPTIAEAGVPGAESSGWYGLLVTAGTPLPVVSKLHAETTQILYSAALREQFSVQGLAPIPTSPEEFRKVLRAAIEKWGAVIKASGAKPE